MSDDLPAQACVVFCVVSVALDVASRRRRPLSLFVRRRRGGRGADVLHSKRHRSVAFASIYATSAPSVRTIGSPGDDAVDATRGDAVSYFKRLELVLRLAHVGLEEGERAELLNSIASISIYRIVPFMDLDAT